MTNQEIIDYVMETPNNTNPAILNQMLETNKGSQSLGFDMKIYDLYGGRMWYEGDFSLVVKKIEESFPTIIVFTFEGEGYSVGLAWGATKFSNTEYLRIRANSVQYYVYPDGKVERV